MPTLATTFLEHRKALGQYLRRRTGCADTADELLHELWLRSHGVTAAGILNPAAYLFRTAVNVAFDWRRRETVLAGRLARAEEGEAVADDEPSPERLVEAGQARSVLQDAVDALPPKCRQAFLLCRIEGLTMREAGTRHPCVEIWGGVDVSREYPISPIASGCSIFAFVLRSGELRAWIAAPPSSALPSWARPRFQSLTPSPSEPPRSASA